MTAARLALDYIDALKWPAAVTVIFWSLIRTIAALFTGRVEGTETWRCQHCGVTGAIEEIVTGRDDGSPPPPLNL